MNSSPVKSKAFIRMCLYFANIVINPDNLYLIEGKVSFFMLSVASPFGSEVGKHESSLSCQ